MGVLYGFLILVEIVVCALLIVVIFMQKTKGGMGGSAFGGGAGEAIFGSRMGNVLTKSTVVLAVIFLLNTLILTVLSTQRIGVTDSVMEGAARRPVSPQQQPGAVPGPAPATDWMDMDMQPAAEVPLHIPVSGVEVDSEDVIQIPGAEEAFASDELPATLEELAAPDVVVENAEEVDSEAGE